MPLALLVGYVEEPNQEEYQLIDDGVIRPEDVQVMLTDWRVMTEMC